ncbi:hypothetical protein ACFOW1_09675 [Parasediminibacterium paludis]|uniref:Uncharacterized protein n=1 Tax=Parasediminibacterium paludis TaxID=908966 RepID=A0ABV8PY48_9BACT
MKRYDTRADKLIELYLKSPILVDSFVSIIFFAVSRYKPLFIIKNIDKVNQLNIVSTLIGTCVSLAGFILAALTIIVTFKANIDSKRIETRCSSDNNEQLKVNNNFQSALHLLFSSQRYYNGIVEVFKGALKEFVLVFVVLYLSWVNSDSIKAGTFYGLTQVAVLAVALTITRSLGILFLILKAEDTKRVE